jgi:hypothetical protein
MSFWTKPLKRNWTRGRPQVAVFIRTSDGGQASMCHDSATDDERQLALWLISGAHRMSDKLRDRMHAEWKALQEHAEWKALQEVKCGAKNNRPAE